MKTTTYITSRESGWHASGPTPLPQRFRRALKWGAQYHLERFDMATLKMMLEAEAVGRG